MRHRVIDSPVGPLTLVVDASGALAALYTADQKHFPDAAALGERDDTVAPDAVAQLAEYFAGTRTAFSVELAPRGTAFQHRVWDALAAIPHGQTRSYGQLAADLGSPGASRAVGAATGRNPISIIVPCHRLVGSTGALTGYAGGTERKRWLLHHEGALPGASGLG
ncbi:methylated-DNA--[protein]-cysteine S-methyltransferase [Propioniciclava soli]|uniref:Methylated-DNA--protein-cysteine methyltransferase n=1 Tax=Propioniciclava soli TaxID=2775081 RepID=A0ABZ3C5T6_9ACTN|nr:methylated-DNA--[protein]-cysteine S-methyltransferase [Propioniciclava soli]